MGLSVADFRELVRARLREAGNSKLGQLQSGTNDPPIVTSDQRLLELGIRVAEQMCKTCVPYVVRGVMPSLAAGTRTVSTIDLTMSIAGTSIWRPLDVAWNGVPLRETEIRNLPPGWQTMPAEPRIKYFAIEREGHFALHPFPSVALPLVADGAGTPVSPVDDTDEWDFVPDDLLQGAFVAGAAWMLTLQNTDNDALAARGAAWKQEYDAERFRLWDAVSLGTRKKLFPNPPAVLEAKGMVRGR